MRPWLSSVVSPCNHPLLDFINIPYFCIRSQLRVLPLSPALSAHLFIGPVFENPLVPSILSILGTLGLVLCLAWPGPTWPYPPPGSQSNACLIQPTCTSSLPQISSIQQHCDTSLSPSSSSPLAWVVPICHVHRPSERRRQCDNQSRCAQLPWE
jgi:hypothetical protein